MSKKDQISPFSC